MATGSRGSVRSARCAGEAYPQQCLKTMHGWTYRQMERIFHSHSESIPRVDETIAHGAAHLPVSPMDVPVGFIPKLPCREHDSHTRQCLITKDPLRTLGMRVPREDRSSLSSRLPYHPLSIQPLQCQPLFLAASPAISIPCHARGYSAQSKDLSLLTEH